MIPNFLSKDELASYVELNQSIELPFLNEKPLVGQEVVYAFARHTKNGHLVSLSGMVVVQATVINARLLRVTFAVAQSDVLYLTVRDVEVSPYSIVNVDPEKGPQSKTILLDAEARSLIISHLGGEDVDTLLDRIERVLSA